MLSLWCRAVCVCASRPKKVSNYFSFDYNCIKTVTRKSPEFQLMKTPFPTWHKENSHSLVSSIVWECGCIVLLEAAGEESGVASLWCVPASSLLLCCFLSSACRAAQSSWSCSENMSSLLNIVGFLPGLQVFLRQVWPAYHTSAKLYLPSRYQLKFFCFGLQTKELTGLLYPQLRRYQCCVWEGWRHLHYKATRQ